MKVKKINRKQTLISAMKITCASQFPYNVLTCMVGIPRKQFNNCTKAFRAHLHTYLAIA
jgi:hypothetical protein